MVFVFRTNTDTEIQAIRGGEVDVIYPQPQLQLADLGQQINSRFAALNLPALTLPARQ